MKFKKMRKSFEIFTLSSDRSNRKKNIGKTFCRYSSEDHFPPPPQDAENLMPET